MRNEFQTEAFKINKVPKKNPLFEVFRAGAHSYPQFMENADLLNKEFTKIKMDKGKGKKDHLQYNFSIEINKGGVDGVLRVNRENSTIIRSLFAQFRRKFAMNRIRR